MLRAMGISPSSVFDDDAQQERRKNPGECASHPGREIGACDDEGGRALAGATGNQNDRNDARRRTLSAGMARSIDRNVENALARRPDVLQAYAAEKASEAKLRAARAEVLPKVFLSGTGNYNQGNLTTSAIFPARLQTPIANLSGGRYGGTVLVGAAVPLYDGGVRAALIEQAQTGVDTTATQLARTKHQAIRQIVVANATLTTSISSYEAAKALVAASETTYAAALASYRSGVGDIVAVSLAQTRLLQARNAQTYSASLSAAALLALATGSLGSAPP